MTRPRLAVSSSVTASACSGSARHSLLPRAVRGDMLHHEMFVVANRLPLTVKRNEKTGRLEYTVSAGGMVSALLGVQLVRTVWVGWCPVPEDTTPAELHEVDRTLRSRGCVPIFLPAEESAAYYNGFCNDVLWPLFHYVVSRTPDEDHDGAKEHAQWLAYKRVNEKFADVIASLARESDLVWVHDYHLMLLPSMLRDRRARLKVGWFLHTPWPSSEIFRTLPQRQEVLRGLLGADLVGFHVYDYARHFLHACTRLMGSEVSFSSRRLRWERPLPAESGGGIMQHSLKVDAFPIGIDPRRFRRGLESPRVKARIAELRRQFEGVSLMLGVDRVDYIKGIPQKLLAMESLLAQVDSTHALLWPGCRLLAGARSASPHSSHLPILASLSHLAIPHGHTSV